MDNILVYLLLDASLGFITPWNGVSRGAERIKHVLGTDNYYEASQLCAPGDPKCFQTHGKYSVLPIAPVWLNSPTSEVLSETSGPFQVPTMAVFPACSRRFPEVAPILLLIPLTLHHTSKKNQKRKRRNRSYRSQIITYGYNLHSPIYCIFINHALIYLFIFCIYVINQHFFFFFFFFVCSFQMPLSVEIWGHALWLAALVISFTYLCCWSS